MRTNKKTIDLFAGCGGLTLGFQNAGFDVVAAADNWGPVLAVYRENFNHDLHDLDLSDVEKSVAALKKYGAEVVVGGPPCQDFSQAGKRDENGGRGNLTIAFAEIVSRLRPRFFVMENVDQLTKTAKFKEAEKILKTAGFGITIRLLDASYCGVPQKRKRYFVVGELGGLDDFLGVHLDLGLATKPLTMREYFGNELGTEFYYRHPWSYMRRAVYGVDEPSPTIRGVNRPIPNGYPGHHLDATRDMRKVRPLTTIERARIQTFPKNFNWTGSKTDLEQIIGNAVPVKLAEYVARTLAEYAAGKKVYASPRLTQMEVELEDRVAVADDRRAAGRLL